MGPQVHEHRLTWGVKNHVNDSSTWKFCGCGWVWLRDSWYNLDGAWTAANQNSYWRKWILRFLQHHNEVVRDVPEELQHHIVRWATNTTVRDIPEDDFDMWLHDYWDTTLAERARRAPQPPARRTGAEMVAAGYRKVPNLDAWETVKDHRVWKAVPTAPGSSDKYYYEEIFPTLPQGKAGDVLVKGVDDTVTFYNTSHNKEKHVHFDIITVKTKAGWVGQIVADAEDIANGEIYWESAPCDDRVDEDHKVIKTAECVARELAIEKYNEVKRGLFA